MVLKDFGNVTVSNPLKLAGNQVYFVLQVPSAGGVYHNELWVSDGTAAGTQELYNLDTSTTTNPYSQLMAVGNQLYFTLSSTNSTGVDNQLWVSNGTVAGTQEVYDAQASTLGNLTANGSQLYFTVYSNASGSADTQLFVSNGSMASTAFLTDLQDASYLPSQAVGNQFYFIVSTTDSSGNMDAQLWVSNGTESGTAELAVLGSSDFMMPSVESPLVISNQLYLIVFTTDSSGNMDYQLWVSNGTTSGTVSLADTGLGQYAQMYEGSQPQGVDGKLPFVLVNGQTGDTQLWVTDGTKAGTGSVFDSMNADIDGPYVAGPYVYFDQQISDPNASSMYDNNLYVSNLTAGDTTLLLATQNSEFDGIFGSGNQTYAEVGIFTSSGSEHFQLLALTPTAATSISDNVVAGYPAVTNGNQLYFEQPDSAGTGTELYVTSGTPSTTIPLFDFGMGGVDQALAVGNQVYMFSTTGSTSPYDFNAYVSNGTPGGTGHLVDLGQNDPETNFSRSAVIGSQLYFVTSPSNGGPDDYRLYTSNGTPAGTTYTDFGTSIVNDLVVINPTTIGAEYPGFGVARYDSSQATPWQHLTPYDAYSLASGSSGLVGAFAGSVDLWTPQSSWQELSPGTASQVAINDSNQVAAIFPGFGLFVYTPGPGSTLGTWQQLTPYTPYGITIDNNGNVTAAFQGWGLSLYNASTGNWTLLTPYAPSMWAAASGYVAASFNGWGVSLYNESSGSWQQLAPYSTTSIAVDAQGDVLGAFGGAGVYLYRTGSGWTQISGASAQQVALDASGDIFAAFADGLAEYLNNAWRTLTPYEPSQFSV
jgi:ELWxxDGT repeat protein